MKLIAIPYRENPGLIAKCFAFSLLVHAGVLTYLYFNPLLLQGSFASLFGMSNATPSHLDAGVEDPLEKTAILQEVFKEIVVLSPHLRQPYDLVELPKGMSLAPNQETVSFKIPSRSDSLSTSISEHTLSMDTSLEQPEEKIFPPLFLPQPFELSIASQLQIDTHGASHLPLTAIPVHGPGAYEDVISISEFSLNPSYESDYALNLSPQLISPSSLNIGQDLHIKTDLKPLSAEVTGRDLNLDQELARATLFIPKSTASAADKRSVEVSTSFAAFEDYQFPPLAMAAEWNDDFNADVTFLPSPEGRGYIFSIALTPNFDISTHSLKQNLYFIIDRSDSIPKHKFAVFKRGVLKALSSMQKGDTFNIFIIDKKIAQLSKQSMAATLKNIQAAEEFLDKQEAGGLFSAGEIYTSLDKIAGTIPQNDEIHTAILLTDGKTNLSMERRQTAVKKWIEKNQGKLSLYAATVGHENDLIALDLLSSISGGKLLYSDTFASFPRKLAKLVLDLKDPVAKDLLVSAVPHHPQSHIEFYPAHSHLPSLYSHNPYVLIGQIDDPCSFDLIIQGRHGDQWIAIKKNISFIEGQKGNQELTLQWKAQQANLCYAKFLKEGKSTHLKEAKEILKKSRLEIAFE